jgi:hypothetical protein
MDIQSTTNTIIIDGQPYKKGWIQVRFLHDGVSVALFTYPMLHPIWEGDVRTIKDLDTGDFFTDVADFNTYTQDFYPSPGGGGSVLPPIIFIVPTVNYGTEYTNTLLRGATIFAVQLNGEGTLAPPTSDDPAYDFDSGNGTIFLEQQRQFNEGETYTIWYSN